MVLGIYEYCLCLSDVRNGSYKLPRLLRHVSATHKARLQTRQSEKGFLFGYPIAS